MNGSLHEMVELSIVMPCYNEAETVGICIDKAHSWLKRSGVNGEVVVADNGSDDGSIEIARSKGAQLVHVEAKGYGNALMGGIAASRGRYIVMGDSDNSYDFSALDGFIDCLRAGHELVMGCRLPSGGGKIMPGAMPFLHRFGNPGLSTLCMLFFSAPVRDVYCGLRAFTRESYDRMNLKLTGMEFAVEMIMVSSLLKLKIVEVPITLYPDGRSRRSHLRTWPDGWRTLRLMLLYSPKWLFLWPGMLLVLFGGTIGVRLLYGPIFIGSAGLDINTLLSACMGVILGIQLTFFGIFAQLFAISEGLLPASNRLQNIFRVLTLEKGIVLGVAVLLAGFGLLVAGFLEWQQNNWGELSYPEIGRLTVPAVACIIVGVQIVFSSFFLSILSLPRKRESRGAFGGGA